MIVHDIEAVLPGFRAQAESLMVDECTITAPGTGEPVYDPETNTTTIPPGPEIYSGKCRIQLTAASGDRPLVAIDQRLTVQHTISIPVGAALVTPDCTVLITASAHDPANVGRRFLVRAVVRKSFATAQRFQAEEVQA